MMFTSATTIADTLLQSPVDSTTRIVDVSIGSRRPDQAKCGQQELARLGIDQDDLAAFEAGPERIMPIIRIAKSLDVRPD
jgi:hypothetical protein